MAAPPGWKLHEQLDPIGVITRPAWSADGALLALPASNGTIVIWDAQTGETKSVLLDSPVLTVAFSPDAKFLASGVSDYTKADWSPPTSLEDSYEPLTYDIDEWLEDDGEEREPLRYEHALDPTDDETAETADGLSIPIQITELATGTPVAALWSTHIQAPLSRIVWLPSGDFLVTASRDGLAIWEARTGELAELFTQFGPHFTDVACGSDRDEIVAVTADGRWMTYSIPARQLSVGHRPSGPSRCVAWSCDRLLACGRQDGAIEPPRVCWRLDLLRGLSDGQSHEVSGGGA